MRAVLLAIALVSTAPLAAAASATTTHPPHDHEIVDALLFGVDLVTFSRQRFAARRDFPHLDWSTDGCSAPIVGNTGRSFNFRQACVRHDFGYRNYKRLGRFNESTRQVLDDRFRFDLVESCASRRNTFKIRCLAWAEVFYSSVRAMGGL